MDEETEETETPSSFHALVISLAELSVHVGVMGSIIERYPKDVQMNWRHRIEGYTLWAERQVEEIQEFGSAFDE